MDDTPESIRDDILEYSPDKILRLILLTEVAKKDGLTTVIFEGKMIDFSDAKETIQYMTDRNLLPLSGAEYVTVERERIIKEESRRFLDDQVWTNNELILLAIYYMLSSLEGAIHMNFQIKTLSMLKEYMRWLEIEDWINPLNVERNLVRAGALVCSEIDRRQISQAFNNETRIHGKTKDSKRYPSTDPNGESNYQ